MPPSVARMLLIAPFVALTVVGCGRKGALDVPASTGAVAPVPAAPASGIAATGTADTPVTDGAAPPLLPSANETADRFRQRTLAGEGADAPETGDAVPEGPMAGAVVPQRRFVLDPLL